MVWVKHWGKNCGLGSWREGAPLTSLTQGQNAFGGEKKRGRVDEKRLYSA